MDKNRLRILWAVMFLAGCSSPLAAPAITASQTPVLTVTNLPATTPAPTTLFTPTTLMSKYTKVQQNCPKFKGNMQLESITQGVIFLDSSLVDNLIMYDTFSKVEYQLPKNGKKNYGNGSVSPNRDLYAYTEQYSPGDTQTTFRIVNSRAKIITELTFEESLYNVRWLDDNRLLFETKETFNNGTTIVFNRTTQELVKLYDKLPGFYSENEATLYWKVSYSPNLKMVVYVGRLSGGGHGPILWDIGSKRVLWEASQPVGGYWQPEWSPDEQQFAIMIGGNLYLIQMDGQVISILDHTDANMVTSYKWSPDGKHIAFWNSNSLMTYELSSGKIIDRCIPAESRWAPIWSPDSNQIVINAYENQGAMLLDIPFNVSYQLTALPDILYPLEWMNSIP